jgi:hypothetical protein
MLVSLGINNGGVLSGVDCILSKTECQSELERAFEKLLCALLITLISKMITEISGLFQKSLRRLRLTLWFRVYGGVYLTYWKG